MLIGGARAGVGMVSIGNFLEVFVSHLVLGHRKLAQKYFPGVVLSGRRTAKSMH